MISFDGLAPIKGWDSAYDLFIRQNLTPEMLSFPAPSYYANWHKLDSEGRKTFWVCALRATAALECGLNRLQMYREDGQWVSQVTGKQNVSEGLLQMSYGDPGCDDLFLYHDDKTAFLDDFTRFGSHRTTDSHHPSRTTLNPYRNLLGGIRTWTRLIKHSGPTPPFKQVGGAYWSTVKANKTDSTFLRLMKGAGL